jgi:hypothetical protein
MEIILRIYSVYNKVLTIKFIINKFKNYLIKENVKEYKNINNL